MSKPKIDWSKNPHAGLDNDATWLKCENSTLRAKIKELEAEVARLKEKVFPQKAWHCDYCGQVVEGGCYHDCKEQVIVPHLRTRIEELEAEVHEQVIDCVQMSLTRDAALSQAAHFREEAERKSTRINELELKLAARSLEEDMLHYRIAELDRKIVSSSLYQAGQLDATEAALRWAALRQSGMAPADFLRVGLAALLGEVK